MTKAQTTVPRQPTAPASGRTSLLDAIAAAPPWLSIGMLALSIFILTMPADLRNNGDTVYRFFVTRNLIGHTHTLELECGTTSSDSRLAVGRHNCTYAIYGPGQTIAMLPLYVVGKVAATVTGAPKDFVIGVSARALDPILGAAALVIFYFLAVLIGYRRRTAVALTLLVAFATTFWPDVQSGQESPQVTLALLAAVYAAVRATKVTPETPSEASFATISDNGWIALSGAAAGFGLFTRYDFILETVVLAGFIVWCSWDPAKTTQLSPVGVALRALLWFAAGVAPFALADGVWNTLRFGAPWKVGESAAAQFGFPVWQGVPNLLVSPGKGLVWYAPLLVLVPFAARRFFRRDPRLAWLIGVLFIASLLFYGSVQYWHGDPAWGPRYLFPVVPLLILPLGEIIDGFSQHRAAFQSVALALVTLSFLVQVSAVTVDPWRFWYHLVQQTQNSGRQWQWGATKYNYYWKESPVLYQLVAVRDVLQIAEGNKSQYIPFARKKCLNPRYRGPLPRADAGQLAGVSCRPLNTISPIWLNDRYQWISPLPVPLSLAARFVITAILVLLAALSSLSLLAAVSRAGPPASPKPAG